MHMSNTSLYMNLADFDINFWIAVIPEEEKPLPTQPPHASSGNRAAFNVLNSREHSRETHAEAIPEKQGLALERPRHTENENQVPDTSRVDKSLSARSLAELQEQPCCGADDLAVEEKPPYFAVSGHTSLQQDERNKQVCLSRASETSHQTVCHLTEPKTSQLSRGGSCLIPRPSQKSLPSEHTAKNVLASPLPERADNTQMFGKGTFISPSRSKQRELGISSQRQRYIPHRPPDGKRTRHSAPAVLSPLSRKRQKENIPRGKENEMTPGLNLREENVLADITNSQSYGCKRFSRVWKESSKERLCDKSPGRLRTELN